MFTIIKLAHLSPHIVTCVCVCVHVWGGTMCSNTPGDLGKFRIPDILVQSNLQ